MICVGRCYHCLIKVTLYWSSVLKGWYCEACIEVITTDTAIRDRQNNKPYSKLTNFF